VLSEVTGLVNLETGVVVAQEMIIPGHFVLTLAAPGISRTGRPGQFVMIDVGAINKLPHPLADPFWRRAFGLYRADPEAGRVDILYRAGGKGSRLLALAAPGDKLSLLGPLGNGFPLEEAEAPVALVGGGTGVPPLVFAARVLAGRGIQAKAYIGGRSANQLFGLDDFAACGVPVQVSTDDGSAGVQGVVTDILRPDLEALQVKTVFACGPTPMLRAVQGLVGQYKLPAYLSVEAYMACGRGLCLGCAVRLAGEGEPRYAHACTDGPVFRSEEVVL